MLSQSRELLKAKRVKSFEELGIETDDAIIDRLLETGFCRQYKKQLLVYQHTQKCPEAFQEFLEKKTTILRFYWSASLFCGILIAAAEGKRLNEKNSYSRRGG